MNEIESQPNVAPPASYKTPSLPTLAALGVISTAALASGCNRMGGSMITPIPESAETQNVSDEKLPEKSISEGGVVFLGEIAP